MAFVFWTENAANDKLYVTIDGQGVDYDWDISTGAYWHVKKVW